MTKLDKWVLNKMKESDRTDTWLPGKVIYTDEELSPWSGGFCRYKLFSWEIRIRPKYEGKDNGILEHELTHAQQYGRLFWLHLLFKSFDKYTLWVELEAYRNQVKCYKYTEPKHYDWIITALLSPEKYGLKITKEQAKEYADFMFEDILKSNKG